MREGIEADSLLSQTAQNTRDPAQAFERQWASALLNQVFESLKQEMVSLNKEDFYEAFQPHLWGESDSIPYADLAQRFDMSLSNVKVTAHRTKHRYRALLRREIAATLADPNDIDDEIRHLLAVEFGIKFSFNFRPLSVGPRASRPLRGRPLNPGQSGGVCSFPTPAYPLQPGRLRSF